MSSRIVSKLARHCCAAYVTGCTNDSEYTDLVKIAVCSATCTDFLLYIRSLQRCTMLLRQFDTNALQMSQSTTAKAWVGYTKDSQHCNCLQAGVLIDLPL